VPVRILRGMPLIHDQAVVLNRLYDSASPRVIVPLTRDRDKIRAATLAKPSGSWYEAHRLVPVVRG